MIELSGRAQPVEATYLRERESDRWLGGAGVRLTRYQKQKIRAYCFDRDGLKCSICSRPETNPALLQIHHIDHDAGNHYATNLALAHATCNIRAHQAFYRGQGVQLVSYPSKRERTRPGPMQLEPCSLEVKLNRDYEPLYRRKSFEFVKQSHELARPITKISLRQTLREFVGCAGPTSYSYDERLFAPVNGPLMEDFDAYDGTHYVRFKDHQDNGLSLDDLVLKYPKEGQRFAVKSDK